MLPGNTVTRPWQVLTAGYFEDSGIGLIAGLAALFGVEDESALWALAIACHQQAGGHVCADLDRLGRDGLVTEVAGEARRAQRRSARRSKCTRG